MTVATPPSPPRGRTPGAESATATIGASTFVKGRIEGTDDLVVQGRVEGTIKLPDNRVFIARGSRVEADVKAHSVEVDGLVRGKLEGVHSVTVKAGGEVTGDIVSPRVILEPGARFNGSVDTGDGNAATPAAQSTAGRS